MVPLPIRDAGSLTGLLNAGMMDSVTVIVMNHGHENDVTGLIEEGGKSSFLLATEAIIHNTLIVSVIYPLDSVLNPILITHTRIYLRFCILFSKMGRLIRDI